MNNKLTEIVFLLDRSGSMYGMEADTVGGFNSVIERQKKESGDALVSTILFNDRADVIHDRIPIGDVPPMTADDFRVGGSTALVDALAGAIRHIAMIHKYARREDVPAHTIFVIMTDGMENASRKYTAETLKRMVEHEKKEYSWEFIFLAANIDAVETSARYGIDAGAAVNYHNDRAGSRASFDSIHYACATIRRDEDLCENSTWREKADADYRTGRR